MQLHIPPYEQGNRWNLDPLRKRKLLLHRAEIAKLKDAVARKGQTLVPLKLYFARGHAKLLIGVGKGKKTYDKRHAIAERDAKREMDRRRAAERRHADARRDARVRPRAGLALARRCCALARPRRAARASPARAAPRDRAGAAHRRRADYVGANDLARLLEATKYWRADVRKLVLRAGAHRVTLTADNAVRGGGRPHAVAARPGASRCAASCRSRSPARGRCPATARWRG